MALILIEVSMEWSQQLFPLLFLVAWILLQTVVLPRAGVAT